MPYERTSEPRGLCHKFAGTVRSPEFLQAMIDTHKECHFDTIDYVIVDCLDVECFDVKMKTVLEAHLLSFRVLKTNPGIMVAVITTDPVVSRLAQLGRSIGPAYFMMKVFPTVADAREWIKNDDARDPAPLGRGTGSALSATAHAGAGLDERHPAIPRERQIT